MGQAKSDLRDKRGGGYDMDMRDVPRKRPRVRSSEHEKRQGGADVRPMPEDGDQPVPEGLRRPRKGPLGPKTGRRGGNAQ